MKAINLGLDARRRALFLDPDVRAQTHTHIIGGSGTGKSKFMEWLIRQDIRAGHGLCLIDWHGTLYNDVLRYCAYMNIGGMAGDAQSVILLNPSKPDFVTGFNPFMNRGADISTQVNNRIAATIRPWGITDTNEMPTFERLARLIYTFAAENDQTLINAAKLLQFGRPQLRQYAADHISETYVREQWRELELLRGARDWRDFVLSTDNRFSRFLAPRAIRRFMGLHEGNLDLADVMDRGQILLVNLGRSDYLDPESARVFASLLINEFMEVTMRRAQRTPGAKPSQFILYMDEFQEYMTEDVGSMLDQVRKGGLHMVLGHQHLGHFEENKKLKQSVITNARLRAVFGGLSFEDAIELANEMFLPDLNTRQIKKAYYHTIHLYREETRTSYSRGRSSSQGTSSSGGSVEGSGSASAESSGTSRPTNDLGEAEGWFTETSGTSHSTSAFANQSSSWSSTGSESETESESEFPVWVPIPVQELASEVEWSMDEKRSKVAEMLKVQTQRHCFIKLDTEKTQPLLVPLVKDYLVSQNLVDEYERALYEKHGALSAEKADAAVAASEQKFLEVAGAYTDNLQVRAEAELIGRERE